MKPGSQSDILRHIIPSQLQSNRDYQTETDSGYERSDSGADENYGAYDVTWADTEVQDPQADEVAGPSSNNDGGNQPSDEQHLQSSSPPSSGGSQAGDNHVPPKTASVSQSGNGGGAGGSGRPSSSTRPRQPGPGRRPVTKCRSVPVVYSGETVVRLGQICYQVPRDGS